MYIRPYEMISILFFNKFIDKIVKVLYENVHVFDPIQNKMMLYEKCIFND